MNNLDDRHPDLSAGAVRSDNMPTMLNRAFRGFSAACPPGWLHFCRTRRLTCSRPVANFVMNLTTLLAIDVYCIRQ